MLIRSYQIVKTVFLPPLPLNLNVFHIIIADQSFIYFSFLQSYFFGSCLCHASLSKLITNIKCQKYMCNDPLTWIFIGQMSGSH